MSNNTLRNMQMELKYLKLSVHTFNNSDILIMIIIIMIIKRNVNKYNK